MELKLDRLLDEEFKYSYRDFYYQTKSVLFNEGITVRVNVQYDLLKGLQLVRKDGSKTAIKSINQLICCTLFNFCTGLSNQRLFNAVDTLFSHFYENSKIPLFSTEENMELSIWSRDMANKAVIPINSMRDLVVKVDDADLINLLKEAIETKVLTLKIKVLNESNVRKEFEKVLFEDIEEKIQEVVREKISTNYQLARSEDLSMKVLTGIYGCELSSPKAYITFKVKSLDRVLAYLHLSHGSLAEERSMEEYVAFFNRHCENKKRVYDQIVDIISGKDLNTLMYLNPSW